jgi:hypothetical protein
MTCQFGESFGSTLPSRFLVTSAEEEMVDPIVWREYAEKQDKFRLFGNQKPVFPLSGFVEDHPEALSVSGGSC